MQSMSRASLVDAEQRLAHATGGAIDPAGARDLAEGMFGVADLLGHEAALRRALADPATPVPAKVGLVDGLFGSRLPESALLVLRELVEARWSRPTDLLQAVETLGVTVLLRLAEADGTLDAVEDELFRFGRIIDREPGLRAALTDSGVPIARRVELMHQLLAGKADPVTLRLTDRILQDPLKRPFDRALEELIELAAERRQRLIATVRVTAALGEQQQVRLEQALTRLYGQQVQAQVEIDPDLVGGMVVEVGDEVFDASLSRRIADVRRRLG